VKNVTSIDNLSLVSIEGNGMMGVPGISARIFSALAGVRVNVMMISQASSEHNVCLVIPQIDRGKAVTIAPRGIRIRDGEEEPSTKSNCATTCPSWRSSGKDEMARAASRGNLYRGGGGRVNIVAIAQGSSELNISLVVEGSDAAKPSRPSTTLPFGVELARRSYPTSTTYYVRRVSIPVRQGLA
jgi:aspartokinase/homoserine dehydrogenase 1